ncbi:plasmid maintenance system antidote protein [Dysgonomonas sp. GY75]|uniref:helix-turn-helix transcriptional regulator n=1 Tax=Dysgonomonas sp. GY75 TaxID=2780419 RepID=UPI0018837F59|nr:plasmid maintenance system antidote protein [Dysgonomonas sp. GY75]MBF0648631.1 plasmid maintenance system antidote protein [Dysgonomonas sp. GY75]
MLPEIIKIKGVHPGAVLSRELKRRGLESKQFALSLGEYPQTINAISKGRRGINPALSIKLGHALDTDEEYFMLLQAYYEVERERKELLKNQQKPGLDKIRTILFWDTNINLIDWQKQRKAVIRRIFERGNDVEIKEIITFYGENIVKEELMKTPRFLPALSENAIKYLGINLNSGYADE